MDREPKKIRSPPPPHKNLPPPTLSVPSPSVTLTEQRNCPGPPKLVVAPGTKPSRLLACHVMV